MAIKLEHVNYIYGADTELSVAALKDVNLSIEDGQFIGLIGHTGSGKSTLVQHLNGLLKATSGAIYYNGKNIYDKDYNMKELRSKVGLVFQYPEHQLFEIDVFSDVCFGPKNLGCSKEETEKRARHALDLVARLPGLHFLNKTCGALFGLVQACVLLFVAAWLLQFFGHVLPESLVNQTHLLKFFMTTNPLSLLSGL